MNLKYRLRKNQQLRKKLKRKETRIAGNFIFPRSFSSLSHNTGTNTYIQTGAITSVLESPINMEEYLENLKSFRSYIKGVNLCRSLARKTGSIRSGFFLLIFVFDLFYSLYLSLDAEDETAKRSAEEQRQKTAIETLENDLNLGIL